MLGAKWEPISRSEGRRTPESPNRGDRETPRPTSLPCTRPTLSTQREMQGLAKTNPAPLHYLGIGAIAAVLALAGAVAAVLALIPGDNHAPRDVIHPSMVYEEKMVSRLIAGDSYGKLMQIIGTEPDNQQALKAGIVIYQFDRSWEYIDLLVKNSQVLSVGVYARSTSFKTRLDAGGDWIAVNGPSIAQQASFSIPLGAFSVCPGGDSPESFFEGFRLPEANLATSFAVGWVQGPPGYLNTPTGARATTVLVPYSACGTGTQCNKVDEYFSLSPKFFACFNDASAGRKTQRLSPSAVIVTAPYGNVTSDMTGIIPSPFSPP
jgi:hypothetical protein